MPANAIDLEAALLDLARTSPKYRGKKTQMDVRSFGELIAVANAWLETRSKNVVSSELDKKLVAQVIVHKPAVKQSFIPASNGTIGGYAATSLEPLVAAAVVGPVYTLLSQSYDYKETPTVRRDVARVLGLTDKGHSSHGSNFKGSQTLRQIIDNLTDTVEGKPEIARLQGLMRRFYPGYLT